MSSALYLVAATGDLAVVLAGRLSGPVTKVKDCHCKKWDYRQYRYHHGPH